MYPDDGVGFGDYPKLPMISAASKDPYEDWDMPHLKRNYCEPVGVYNEFCVTKNNSLITIRTKNHCALF